MKKIFSLMVIMATAFAFVACEKAANVDDKKNPGGDDNTEIPEGSKLATPELSETHDATSITISWNPVSGAESYLVSMPGNNANVTECTYTFSNLNAGTYTIRVKAVGRGYEDSDNAKIVVELTGLTEVDWFEQTLTNVTEPVEVDGRVVNPWNGVYFTWKGTGVAEIRAAMFMTDDLEGASDADIKEQLSDASAVLSYVNSEEGYTAVYEGLTGSTSYTLCTLVKNAEGLECLV
ncbi:MAG: fibronectin type III domain-containing protein, partial [Alistipes sp.]|nr:fibronectin type III domain-containing protein [Alistipes sp.]